MKANVQGQLKRLLSQLSDIEEMKDDLDEDEYEETKQHTLHQLQAFQTDLNQMMAGDMTLVSDLNSMQLAIQTAVQTTFSANDSTFSVCLCLIFCGPNRFLRCLPLASFAASLKAIKMFASAEPDALRQQMEMLRRDVKLGKISPADYHKQAVEVYSSLI